MVIEDYKERLKLERNKLVINKWLFLNNEWPLVENKFNCKCNDLIHYILT